MNITILSAVKSQGVSKAGKAYSYIELAYKGEDGQVKGKKIMPFGDSKGIHDTLAQATPGDVYSITAVKNEGTGYWDWTNATKTNATSGGANSATTSVASTATASKSTYETAEERAKKQVYIVRQSSLANAVAFYRESGDYSVEDVVNTAKQFEAYVFDTGTPPAAAKVPEFSGDEDDVL